MIEKIHQSSIFWLILVALVDETPQLFESEIFCIQV